MDEEERGRLGFNLPEYRIPEPRLLA